MSLALSLLLLSALPSYELQARFEPAAKAGHEDAVLVSFSSADPDLRLDEVPPPRLKLDATQSVLVDRQAPPTGQAAPVDPAKAHYLDTGRPVSFPVALAKDAAKGPHEVKATVTYFYCSLKQGWCRKGTGEVALTVNVP
jgi:hypothetical protein